MAVKPTNPADYKEIEYTNKRWRLLQSLRDKAIEVMTALEVSHLPSVVHGSVARGDVKATSDVDVFIPEVQNSFLVESALEKAKITIHHRLIVQATPHYAVKAHIELSDKVSVTFPLVEMRRVEREFYRFGGEASLNQLKSNCRVFGVDKRLMLIEPTEKGHIESSIIGKEEATAKVLGIASESVLNRVNTLTRRDSIGRTGIFVKKEVGENETFELALKKLVESNPAVRRRMEKGV